MNKFIFREAIESDYNEILILKKQVHKFHYMNKKEFYMHTETPITKSDFINIIVNKQCSIYIIEKNKKVCAYAITKVLNFKNNSLIKSHKRLFIDDICVNSSLRKKGIGKLLMSKLEGLCRLEGYQFIDLNVWNFNDQAIAFFKNFGMNTSMLRMEKEVE